MWEERERRRPPCSDEEENDEAPGHCCFATRKHMDDPFFPRELVQVILMQATRGWALKRMFNVMALRLTCKRLNEVINEDLKYEKYNDVWADPWHDDRRAWWCADGALFRAAKRNLFTPLFYFKRLQIIGRPRDSSCYADVVNGYVRGGHLAVAREAIVVLQLGASELNTLAGWYGGGRNPPALAWLRAYVEANVCSLPSLTMRCELEKNTVVCRCDEDPAFNSVVTYSTVHVAHHLFVMVMNVPFTVQSIVLHGPAAILRPVDLATYAKEAPAWKRPMPTLHLGVL
jgi:hypothetical protein